MPTQNYTFAQLFGNQGEGTSSISLTSGTAYTFGITSSLDAGYLTLETVRDYDNTSPRNTSGSFSASINIASSVISDYIAGFSVPQGNSSFIFTPATNVVGSTLKLRGVGGVVLGVSYGSVIPPLPFRFAVTTNSAGASASNQFRLPLTSSGVLNMEVFWGDGTSNIITTASQAEVTHTYSSAGTYNINISGSVTGWQFNGAGDARKMRDITRWGTFVMDKDSAFRNCQSMTVAATDAPTITTTSLYNCFFYCFNFNGAVGNWDVSGVTNMEGTFLACNAFNQPLNSWNVSNVTNMKDMFNGSNTFNQPLNSWDVSNVTNMNGMFYNIAAFDQNLGSWNIINVTNIGSFLGSKTPSTFSSTNLDAIYNGWSQLNVQPNLAIDFGTAKYSSTGVAGRDYLVSSKSWTIIDGGLV